jgi:preprotein translocase subunit YajC
MTTNAPKVGDKFTTRAGMLATIIKVHPFGTIDIQIDATGDCFRVTGLPFVSARPVQK